MVELNENGSEIEHSNSILESTFKSSLPSMLELQRDILVFDNAEAKEEHKKVIRFYIVNKSQHLLV